MIDSQRWAGTQAAYRGGQLSNFLRPEDRPRSCWGSTPNNGIVTRPQCIRNGLHNSCNVNQLDLLLAFGFVIVIVPDERG